MTTYRIITTGDDVTSGEAYEQFGDWSFVGTHNDGELWTVVVPTFSATPFERMLDTDATIFGYEEIE